MSDSLGKAQEEQVVNRALRHAETPPTEYPIAIQPRAWRKGVLLQGRVQVWNVESWLCSIHITKLGGHFPM